MTIVIVISLLPLCVKETTPVLTTIEWVCATIFVLDYLARWCTSDKLLRKGRLSYVIYPIAPMAVVDLVSILPTFILLNPAWRALRVLRLFRSLRAFKLVRYSRGMSAIARVFAKQKTPLLAVLALATGYVLVCALVIFNVEPNTFNRFFDAVYWAVVSLTTVGYGDLYPTTDIGRLIAMLSSLMGIAIVALPAGIITAGIMDEIHEPRSSHREQELPSTDL